MITIVIILTAVLIVYQDFKFRGVSWLLFPLMAIAASLYAMECMHLDIWLINSTINLCFITLQWIMMSVYMSIKEKRLVAVTSNWLGWGDVLFWLSIAFMFSFTAYLVFFLVSLVLGIVFYTMTKILNLKSEQTTIPLAGIQAFCLILFLFLYLLGCIPDIRTEKGWLLLN
jgi:hypothetical protein